MHRIAVLAAWSFLRSPPPLWRCPSKLRMLPFPSGSETIAGYLAAPESPGKHPGLVVIHEDWGLTDWVKDRPGSWRSKDTWLWPWISTAVKWPMIPPSPMS